MKALIITEDVQVSKPLNDFFKKNGIDTIIYKWLLKALDNVEEIQPDLIVINSVEYPRLWKTLVQYVKSGIGGENVRVYLYEQNSLSEEDKKKYDELKLDGCISDLSDSSLQVLLNKNDEAVEVEAADDVAADDVEPAVDIAEPVVAAPASESENYDDYEECEVPTVESITKTGTFIFTNPKTNNFVTGQIELFSTERIICRLDFETALELEEKIPEMTLQVEDQIYDYSGIVKETIPDENKVIFQLQSQIAYGN